MVETVHKCIGDVVNTLVWTGWSINKINNIIIMAAELLQLLIGCSKTSMQSPNVWVVLAWILKRPRSCSMNILCPDRFMLRGQPLKLSEYGLLSAYFVWVLGNYLCKVIFSDIPQWLKASLKPVCLATIIYAETWTLTVGLVQLLSKQCSMPHLISLWQTIHQK